MQIILATLLLASACIDVSALRLSSEKVVVDLPVLANTVQFANTAQRMISNKELSARFGRRIPLDGFLPDKNLPDEGDVELDTDWVTPATSSDDYIDNGELTIQSFPADSIQILGAKSKTAYVTMCITDEAGATQPLNHCLESLCSLRKVSDVSNVDVVLMVNKKVTPQKQHELKSQGLHVVELPSINFNERKSKKEGNQTGRLYTYFKFHAWRLIQFDRIFWFDADVFFLQDPKRIVDQYKSEPQKTTAAYFGNVSHGNFRGAPYVNTGVMLFKPSIHAYRGIVRRWLDGRYEQFVGNPTEQDILCFGNGHELGHIVPMDICYNYRGYEFQKRCKDENRIPLLHGHHPKARCNFDEALRAVEEYDNELNDYKNKASYDVEPYYNEFKDYKNKASYDVEPYYNELKDHKNKASYDVEPYYNEFKDYKNVPVSQ